MRSSSTCASPQRWRTAGPLLAPRPRPRPRSARARPGSRRRRGRPAPRPGARSARAPRSTGTGRERAGIGRPTTRYFCPVAAGDREREEDALGERRREPVGEPEVRVGLGERRPGSASVRAASAIGPATYPPPPRTTSGRRRRRIRTHAGTAAAASPRARTSASPGRRGRPSTRNCSSSKPAAGTSVASARSRAGEDDLGAARPKRLGDGERRQDVPGCSAGGDQAHGLALRRRHGSTAMLRRIPTAASPTMRLDPP